MPLRRTPSQVASSRVIGRTLKRWRTERGLSLRGVQKAAHGHPEPIGFDYLSRLENGELMPSVPKLSTLAQVYERPISDLVDLYESVARGRLAPRGASRGELQKLGSTALVAGEYAKAFACFENALDAAAKEGIVGERRALMHHALALRLIKAGRYLTARQYLEEALRAVETVASRGVIMRSLAIVHENLGDQTLADVLTRAADGLEGRRQSVRKRSRS